MPTGKILKIYSKEITQNTTDNLRKAIGTHYQIKEDDDGTQRFEFPYAFTPTPGTFLPLRPIKVADDPELDLRGVPVIRAEIAETLESAIEQIQVNPSMIQKVSNTAYLPNYKIPVRLYANREGASGDSFWKTYFMGGEFGGKTYPRIIDNETIFYDVQSVLYHPYSQKEVNVISKLSVDDKEPLTSVWKIQCNYNDYDEFVQNYQDWSATQHELLLPNFHFSYTQAMLFATPDSAMKTMFIGMIPDLSMETRDSMNEYFSDVSGGGAGTFASAPTGDPLTKQVRDLILYFYPDVIAYYRSTKNEYFGRNFIEINQDLETKERAKHIQENIMFDSNYYRYFSYSEEGATSGTAIERHEKKAGELGLPLDVSANMMNISIDFTKNVAADYLGSMFGSDSEESDRWLNYNFSTPQFSGLVEGSASRPHRIRDMIQLHDFDSKFLESLKDLDEGAIPIRFNKTEYDVQTTVYNMSGQLEEKTTSLNLRTFEWFDFLTSLYNNFDGAINDNYIFMGPPKIAQSSTYSDSTIYRFINNQNLLEVLDESIDLTHEYFEDFMEIVMEEGTTVGGPGTPPAGGYTNMSSKILQSIISPIQKPHEVLAYKIEKFGGDTTGDSSTQDLIQKFWVFNMMGADEKVSILDTQVKYGQDYTYKGYAYVAVMSHKYRYGDFRLTKQIGIYDADDDPEDEFESTRYCLQFYDPLTEELAEQIFTVRDTSELAGMKFSGVEYLSEDVFQQSVLTRYNTFATNGQDLSLFPQLADFNISIEPCIKIIEVPIFEKTLGVYDNPPNNISVVPFHFVDDSQKLGFDLFSDGFKMDSLYPIPITNEDKTKRNAYLNSKDIDTIDGIEVFSESPARFIEIFRSTERPTSFESFDGKLISRIDLRIPNTEFNRKDFVAADKVTTNKKYYYVFRFVNENGCPGQLSPVLEAELHSDGGYIYSLFDVVDSSEFKPDVFTNNSTQFKRIFQLEPNMKHLMLDTVDADFSKTAKQEINNVKLGTAEDSIWDKKFKIRLTSKKTDKKLDINVTYKVREKDLSPERTHYKTEDE